MHVPSCACFSLLGSESSALTFFLFCKVQFYFKDAISENVFYVKMAMNLCVYTDDLVQNILFFILMCIQRLSSKIPSILFLFLICFRCCLPLLNSVALGIGGEEEIFETMPIPHSPVPFFTSLGLGLFNFYDTQFPLVYYGN